MNNPNAHHVFSFGGGIQSQAALILAAQGRIPYRQFVFANVGDDSENPETLKYIENYALPYAKKNGIELHITQRTKRKQLTTLRQEIFAENRRVPIPAFLPSGAPGNRACTIEFKIEVIDKWCKVQGYRQVVVGIGFSIDEIHRARTQEWTKAKNGIAKLNHYPLLDLRLSRHQCASIIQAEGLPVPPKSACYFCPYHSTNEWYHLRESQPILFQDAIAIEKQIQSKRAHIGRDQVFLHPSLRPLETAVGNQPTLNDPETDCNLFSCMT